MRLAAFFRGGSPYRVWLAQWLGSERFRIALPQADESSSVWESLELSYV